MNRQTFLTTERLDLVMLTSDDAQTLSNWFNDQTITDFLARGDYPMTTQAEADYIEKLYSDQAHLQLGVWHRDDKKLIGTTGWHGINVRDRQASFGIMIGESDYWGNGYGTDVLEAMLHWAFNVRDLRSVTLSVLGNNPRGKRCYEKCGFVEVGRYPQHVFKAGQWHDEILMHMHNPAYQ